MWLVKLPINEAWAFVLGDTIVGIDGQYIFPSRADAVEQASHRRLGVMSDGRVLPVEDMPEKSYLVNGSTYIC